MASASAIRSPPIPNKSDLQIETCSFRRSRSRVFYESECTAGTSWEFKNVHLDSPVYQMQLSLLRSPGININGGLDSPLSVVPIADSTSIQLHPQHRTIPSPNKEDLSGNGSDASRNSTGSSTGSHRSQDSGFSDSGESKPPRRVSVSSPSVTLPQHENQNMSSNRSNQYQCNENCCSQIGYQDPNKNYLPSLSLTQQNHNRSRSATFVVSPPPDQLRIQEGSRHQQQSSAQSIYSQHQPHHHERCYSTPVPSPIPHSGSGCGKLILKNGSMLPLPSIGNIASPPNLYHHPSHQIHTQLSSRGDYGEISGNNVGPGCPSNCIYQEINLSHSPSIIQYHQSQNRSGTATPVSECGTYSLYSAISPIPEPTGHFGAPICSSTPKRSNVSSASTSRLSIMQKIDNFESLNKNKKSLDNNNNSNGSGNGSQTNVTSNSGTSSNSLKGHQHVRSKTPTKIFSPSHQSHSLSPINESVGKSSKTSKSRQTSKSSLSTVPAISATFATSPGLYQTHQPTTSSSNLSTTTDFVHNGNQTVIRRAPLPLPISSESSRSMHGNADCENNNLALNEFSTYASQTELKSCTKISPEWQGLPKGFKRIPVNAISSSSLKGSARRGPQVDACSEKHIIVKSHFDNDAMRMWLHELRSQTEHECFYMLQTKSLIPDSISECRNISPVTINGQTFDLHSGQVSSTADNRHKCNSITKTARSEANQDPKGHRNKIPVVQAVHAISAPLMSIRNVEQMANVVSGEFAKICKNIEFGFLSQVPTLVLSLVNHVEEFLRTFQGSSAFGNLLKLENRLSRNCRRLQRSAQTMIEVTSKDSEYKDPRNLYSIIEPENNSREGYHVAVNEVVDGIVTVGNLFSQVVDLRLTRDLSCILDTIEGGGVPAKVALKSFATILIDGGTHLCRLASEIRTVRGLLGVILDAKDDYLRILSLRCLATVLCVGEAVKDFDRASGFEIVADFMYDPMYSLELKVEAVSVLTQATDPWIDLETSLCTLGAHLEKIVVALSNLIRECKSSEEQFLLAVAAISNLTFLEVSSIGILRRCNTVALLIEAVETTECNYSVFVLDHIATILANMAGVESCRDAIVKSGGVHALLNFLQKRPSPSVQSAAEIMACERVQQKSTIAISRLCTEEGVAQLILDRGGLHRLVMLSRNEKERNYSDGVLIAALATLRKLVSVCGDEIIRGLQADDLIQPRLLDSFLLYSSRQESYV